MCERRVNWIDSVRGIAISLVVYGHVIGGYTGNYSSIEYQNFVTCGLKIIYSFHMPLFFMISGYVYALGKNVLNIKQYRNFISKKARQLLIPYYVCSVVQILIKLPLQGKISSVLSWKDIFLLPIKPVDQYWYIYVLFFMFCIQPSLEMNHKDSLALAFIMLLVGKGLSLYEGAKINAWFAVPIKILSFYLYFYIGIILRRKNRHYSKKHCALFLTAFCLLTPLSLNCNSEYAFVNTFLSIILAVIGSFMVISLSQSVHIVGNCKVLDILGKSSMMIYIIHVLLCAVIRVALLKININNFYVSVVIGTALSLLIPTIADYYWKHFTGKYISNSKKSYV